MCCFNTLFLEMIREYLCLFKLSEQTWFCIKYGINRVSFCFRANAYLDKYEALQGGSGSADVAGAWDFLKGLKTLSGRPFEDDELETTMKSIMGEEKVLDQKRFIELISRIKLTRN